MLEKPKQPQPNLQFGVCFLLESPQTPKLCFTLRNLIWLIKISRAIMTAAFVTYTHKFAALTIRGPQRERAIQCRPKQSTKQCVIAKNTLFLSAQPSLSSSSLWPVHDFSSFFSLRAFASTNERIRSELYS